MNCTIYTRTAAANAERVVGQREAVEAYIAGKGLVVSGHYEDDGYSGNTADRPGLRRLMADVAAGKVGRVVVERLDRLARSQTVFAELLAFLRRHGVELASATETFGPDIIGAVNAEGGVA